MESLFNRPAPRRGRVCLMLTGSLLLHGALIGVGAVWMSETPKDGTVIMDIDPVDEGPAALPAAEIPAPQVEANPSTPTPETPAVEPVAPPAPAEPPMFEPPTPAPPHQSAASRPSSSAPRSGAPTTSRLAESTARPGLPGSVATGSSSSTVPWVTPLPPYPQRTLAIRATGATTVRITTDATGQVSNVVIVHSAGNAILDDETTRFVRGHWHGPPNAARTTQFVYEIR